jgi:uncharacterized membrane protein YfcA
VIGQGFEIVLGAAAVLAGAIASVAGFGIGSVLTPVLAWQTGTKLAVAAVSIPHFLATALRLWMLGTHVDRRVLGTFGLASAAGGLAGALLHARASSAALTLVFGGLLVFAGVSELTGLTRRVRLTAAGAWIAGALSGGLGGLVGNQGGIRSAAMLALRLPRDAFVATATAIALMVDAARMPVYFVVARQDLRSVAGQIAIASAGAVAGTLLGARLLRHVPEPIFRPVVAALLVALGFYVLRSG